MRPGISEFSFGYAVTEEIIRNDRSSIRGAPVFPSLRREGQGGYDLLLNRIGIPLMLQFKLSHKMIRNSAKETRRFKLFNPPFFRIPIMPLKISQQHNLLLKLDNGQNEVYYVSPYFDSQDELNSLYSSGSVVNQCAFIRPRSIGALPDFDEHHISLKAESTIGYLFSSEPTQLNGLVPGQQLLSSMERKIAETKQTLRTGVEQLNSEIVDSLREQRLFEKSIAPIVARRLTSPIDMLYYLVNFFIGSEIILLWHEERRDSIG